MAKKLTFDDVISELTATGEMQDIAARVAEARARSQVWPEPELVFRAYSETPLENADVAVAGQDCYHGQKQADGLAFSCSRWGRKLQPSLRNVFAEYSSDLGFAKPSCGDLSPWAQRRVLLFNCGLTVEQGKPKSHLNIWTPFTKRVVAALIENGVHFILWGSFARNSVESQRKLSAPDNDGIMLIEDSNATATHSAHPSPFSADFGFFGSKPFSRANVALTKAGKQPIDWELP